jgi:ATP-dependent Lon protease
VLARALVKPLVAIEWPNDLEVPAAKPAEGAEVRAH